MPGLRNGPLFCLSHLFTDRSQQSDWFKPPVAGLRKGDHGLPETEPDWVEDIQLKCFLFFTSLPHDTLPAGVPCFRSAVSLPNTAGVGRVGVVCPKGTEAQDSPELTQDHTVNYWQGPRLS